METIHDVVLFIIDNEITYRKNIVHSVKQSKLKGLALPRDGALCKLRTEIEELESAKESVKDMENEELRMYMRKHL